MNKKGSDSMTEFWALFLGGTSKESMKETLSFKQSLILIGKYSLLALTIPASYLFLSYLVQSGIW